MACTRSTRKKYASRPGPAYPANNAGCRGQKMYGNDGQLYESKPNSRGIYTWKKSKKSKKSKNTRKAK